MAEQPIRTVVLAREGAACDRIVDGLVEAGAEVLQAIDPTQATPAAVEALSPQAVVVALEPAVEDALDTFEPVLSAPGVMVIFEESALVLQRTGWDAARWVRHLAAKLHGLGSALPPGAEDGDEVMPPTPALAPQAAAPVVVEPVSGSLQPEAEAAASAGIAVDEPFADAAAVEFSGFEGFDGLERAGGDDSADQPADPAAASAFDPVAAEFEPGALDTAPVELIGLELELDAAPPLAGPDATAGADTGSAYAFDPVSAEFDAGTAADPPLAIDFDLEFELADVDDIAYAPPLADPEPVAGFDMLELEPGLTLADGPAPADERSTVADPVTEGTGGSGLGELDGSTLQLLDPDALPRTGDGDRGEDRPSGARTGLDLAALETRIAGLSLADTDSYGHGPRRGVVLVEGGLGGPDAVRQLLGAIPDGFPRPVLVRLQLDGGRYDRLVRQMERATSLPVQLAEAGMSVAAGEVYFLPPQLLPAMAGGELRFAEQGDLASLAEVVPPDDSALLFLSGADASLVDIAMGPAWQGALVAGQSDDGCYDSVAAHAVAARGGPSGRPDEIASWLLARWMPAAQPSDPGPGGLSL